MSILRNYNESATYPITDLSIVVPIATDSETPGEYDISGILPINIRESNDLIRAFITGSLAYYDGLDEIRVATEILTQVYGTIVIKNITGTDIGIKGLGITVIANGSYYYNPRSKQNMQSDGLLEALESGDIVLNNGARDMSLLEACAYIFEYTTPLTQEQIMIDYQGNEIKMLMGPDPHRSKMVSVAVNQLFWTSTRIRSLDWVPLSNELDHEEAGFTMPFDAVITGVNLYCQDVNRDSRIYLYLDAVKHSTPLLDAGASIQVSVADHTLDIDCTKGQKVRLRAGDNSDGYPDTDMRQSIITIFYHWRKA